MDADPVTSAMLRMYGELHARYGDDARALFHNDRESQHERFAMLCRLFDREVAPFTVHEIGCSLGHFGEYLRERFPLARYSGSDILPEFVNICRRRRPDCDFFLRDVSGALPPERYDFVVTCGMFNVIGDAPRTEWSAFVYRMARAMYALCTRGIGITFLTSYIDPGKGRADLFYQSEAELMDFVVPNLSRHFELDRRGPLYEYALRVYRPEEIHKHFPQSEFAKYFRIG